MRTVVQTFNLNSKVRVVLLLGGFLKLVSSLCQTAQNFPQETDETTLTSLFYFGIHVVNSPTMKLYVCSFLPPTLVYQFFNVSVLTFEGQKTSRINVHNKHLGPPDVGLSSVYKGGGGDCRCCVGIPVVNRLTYKDGSGTQTPDPVSLLTIDSWVGSLCAVVLVVVSSAPSGSVTTMGRSHSTSLPLSERT